MFQQKDVQTLVNNVFEKEERIKQLIAGDEEKKVSLDQEMEAITSQIVDANIEGDADQAKALEEELNKKRLERDSIEGRTEGYRKKLESDLVTNQDLEEIRAAAKRMANERGNKNSKIQEKIDAKQSKIDQLKKEIEELESSKDTYSWGVPPEQKQVERVLKYIEPRKIKSSYSKEKYIKAWIEDQGQHILEQYIEKEERQQASTSKEDQGFTAGVNEDTTEKKTVSYIGMNKVEDVVQEFKKRNPNLEFINTGQARQINGGQIQVEIRYRRKGVGA
ncbi:hypothetical protein ACTWQB_09405 [Piscibacillus sp. B03]|uniref:hypothetical protein n=1 Tax=Piscibacillus sp. B03 TaxID=3457430 RepID=UPI003FCC47E7